MEKKYKITDEDYKKLKNGSIKYFVRYYQTIRYGSRFSWWNALMINIPYYLGFSHGNAEYKRPHQLQYYIIYVHAVDKPDNLFWDKDVMDKFTKEKHLNPGDRITVSYLHINDDGISHWGAGVDEYVVLKNGWSKIGSLMGA